ncbi:MAG: hypothetical protein ABJC89_13225 [Acidobacteriota bacterium]
MLSSTVRYCDGTETDTGPSKVWESIMKQPLLIVATAAFAVFGYGWTEIGASALRTGRQTEKKAAVHPAGKAQPAETTLKVNELPPAVKATVEAETRTATLKGLSREKENGKTVYELETLVNGRTRDLMIDAAGQVYVVEEQLDVDKAPAPVRAALEAKGTIVLLESVLQHGRTTYEGQVKTKAGRKVAMELDANGKPMKK